MNYLEKTRETYRQIAAAYAMAQRERAHLAAQIDRFVSLVKPGGLVLDVGCGPGFDTAVLRQHNLNAVGLDFTLEMMLAGRSIHRVWVPFIQADMRRLPLGRVAEGLWVCASLLHLERDAVLPALREFFRVLRPEGILYLSVKLGTGAQWLPARYTTQAHPRFFTFWQPETLDPLLKAAGFEIADGWQQPGLSDTWLVRYARKSDL